MFILGVGTFQDWYDHASVQRALGFAAEIDPVPSEITAEVVASRIPRELANRFNSDLIRLPDLQPEDYRRIAREAEAKLPVEIQHEFRAEVAKRIQGAIDAKKGVRFLEECIMQVIKRVSLTQIASCKTNLYI